MAHSADLILLNARALTLDPGQPRAETVAVTGRRIAYVGSGEGALALRGPATRVVDVGGRTLLPGIVDSHFHLLWGAQKLDDIRFEGVCSYAEMAEVARAYAAAHPERPWLVGYGLAYGMLPGAAPLTRQHMDSIIADRPLVAVSFDLHTAFANTRALELAGLLGGGPCAPGNEIVMAADGTASGELREPGAYNQVLRLAPRPTPADERRLLRIAMAEAAAFGITSVHNMDGDLAQMRQYLELESLGELTLRISVPLLVTPETPAEALAEAVEMRAAATEMVTAGRVKFFMDGVIESYTALMLDDYADAPGNRGDAIFSAERFTELAAEADWLGLSVSVHAIGDSAVRRTLDGLAHARRANGARDSRHRIEHIEVLHTDDLPDFVELGVTASMQPVHAAISEPGSVWAQRVGRERWGRSFPWQALRAAGVPLVFGSDWPVVTQNPFLGMAAAVGRRPWAEGQPDESQTLAAVLAAYTCDGARAEFQEGEKGRLRAGMLADLVVVDGDLERTAAESPGELASLRAWLTVCGGRVVHAAEGYDAGPA